MKPPIADLPELSGYSKFLKSHPAVDSNYNNEASILLNIIDYIRKLEARIAELEKHNLTSNF